MKNQYFGDINDYRKYGLLRSIISTTKLSVLINWMLTQDDGSTDGKFTTYLEYPQKWSKYDPVLYKKIQKLLSLNAKRKVNLIETTNLLQKTKYFSEFVPDGAIDRNTWFSSLSQQSQQCEFIFLDPDNGIEIKSKPYGRMNSSKFLYWHEVKALWSLGKSLLIYQHFIRESRTIFIQRKLEELRATTPDSTVTAFATPNVVFLMALQPEHRKHYAGIIKSIQENWKEQIQHTKLTHPN